LTILGDNATPSNVVFTGTVSKTIAGSAVTAGVFSSGPLTATLKGLTINVTAQNGILCQGCALLILDNVTVTGTFSNCGINISDRGGVYIQDNVTVNGFGENLGMDVHGGSFGAQTTAGTLTITGPGGASTESVCMVVEHGSQFSVAETQAAQITANVTISGCQIGINVAGHSGFNAFESTGNLSITNGSTTPAESTGVLAGNSSSFDWSINGGTVLVDHYTTCLTAGTLSEITSGAGGRTLSNCTPSSCTQGSVCTLF
jgi:hypothetical protein